MLLLAACSATPRYYEGPRLPAAEVCRVVVRGGPAGPTDRFEARLDRLDGVPLRRAAGEIELLPGTHTLDVDWTHLLAPPERGATWIQAESGSTAMTFELRAGFRYVLFWIGGEQPLRFRELPLE